MLSLLTIKFKVLVKKKQPDNGNFYHSLTKHSCRLSEVLGIGKASELDMYAMQMA